MAFPKLSLFFAKHSQKLALLTSVSGIGFAYAMQPYYEVFLRWALIKTREGRELRPSKRIRELTDTVCSQFDLSDEQKAKLDVFLIAPDQSASIGSILTNGYAFIGLPFFTTYSDQLEIPTDEGEFYTCVIKDGSSSKEIIARISKARAAYAGFKNLRRRCDVALKLKSRVYYAAVRSVLLYGCDTLNLLVEDIRRLAVLDNRCLRSLSQVGWSDQVPHQLHSFFCFLSVDQRTKKSIQVSYIFNRAFRLPARVSTPARLLCYTTLAAVGLFCQWQGLLAWRRYLAFRIDQIVARMNPTMLQAGLIYYDWRLRLNRFCYDRAVDNALTKAKAMSQNDPVADFDPIQAYQDEQLALEREKEQAERKQDSHRIPNSAVLSTATPVTRNAIHDAKTGERLKMYNTLVVPFVLRHSHTIL
ncbi:unnamed protein product [Echinostoma caproni]|uniref:Uncharacterized protein n=1 Tax=Echinostoma caproni TaxID=27848 RepID=A0A183AXM5_9TREM|nr:unnamed protein product [Echinostoma caproni]